MTIEKKELPDEESSADVRQDRLALRDSIIASLPTRSDIYLPTQKIDIEEQIKGLTQVKTVYDELEIAYGPRLRALRDKYKGTDRAFIIGNGPSLNETDLSQLRDEVTFCVNGFFLKFPEIDWTPTFYVVEDHLVAEDRAEEINKLKGPTKLFPAYLAYCLNKDEDVIFYNHRPRKSYPDGFDFSTEADKVTYTGCTVTFSCLQLAHYLGFKELYLIGVDASYSIPSDAEHKNDYGTSVIDMGSDDTNHFHPDYFGKGYRWHDPQVHLMIQAYEEAEKVTREIGRPIFNATVGGMLEVFERRNFLDIFPDAILPDTLKSIPENLTPSERAMAIQDLVRSHRSNIPSTAQSQFPKLVIIDMTSLGRGTATGELKKSLLEDYPRSRLMEVFSQGATINIQSDFMPGADGKQRLSDPSQALQWVLHFDPDVVLFRPTPEKPELTELAEQVFFKSGARFISWITDGWQDRLMLTDPDAGDRADQLLKAWFDRSSHCLAISEPMAREYSSRYATDFDVIANGVHPKDWQASSDGRDHKDIFLLRYSGGLAEDMTLQTLKDVAAAVDIVSRDLKIRFEINTREHWLKLYGKEFSSFSNTKLSALVFDMEAYREWLSAADATLIAYNFDELTASYVSYSMANKLPECLATGKPLLAVGPSHLATINYMESHGLGMVVNCPDRNAVVTALSELATNSELREKMGKEGQEFIFENRSLRSVQKKLQAIIRDAAKRPIRNHVHTDRAYNDLPRRKTNKSLSNFSSSNNQQNNARSLGNKNFSKIGVSMKRMLRFYSGLKGVAILLVIGLAALPALPIKDTTLQTFLNLGPAISIALLVILLTRWILQMTDAIEKL